MVPEIRKTLMNHAPDAIRGILFGVPEARKLAPQVAAPFTTKAGWPLLLALAPRGFRVCRMVFRIGLTCTPRRRMGGKARDWAVVYFR